MTVEVIKTTSIADNRFYYLVKVDGSCILSSYSTEADAMEVANKIIDAGTPEIRETIFTHKTADNG